MIKREVVAVGSVLKKCQDLADLTGRILNNKRMRTTYIYLNILVNIVRGNSPGFYILLVNFVRHLDKMSSNGIRCLRILQFRPL